MYIALQCSSCGTSSHISYFQLCGIWKKGYNDLSSSSARRDSKAVTEITCFCGNQDVYDSPMMDWVFQTLFNEFIKESNVV